MKKSIKILEALNDIDENLLIENIESKHASKMWIYILAPTIVFTTIFISMIFINNIKEKENLQIAKNNEDPITVSNKENIVLKMTLMVDYSLNYKDKETRNNNIEYIVIGKVEKLGDSINYNKERDVYTQIMTTGTIKVDKVLKGELNQKEINFQRLGGVISFAEYEKGLREEQKNKMELCSKLTQEEKENSYVEYRLEEDIKVEEGKTYLMYLDYNSDYKGYSFRFFEYGLREVRQEGKEILVLNNETKKWENIRDVI